MRKQIFWVITIIIACLISLYFGLSFQGSSTKTGKHKEKAHPGWFEQYYTMKANEDGEIPMGLRRKWYRQERALSKKGSDPVLKNVTELGPSDVGGRTRAILIDRADSQHIIAGSVSGGIWQSYDNGHTWQSNDDFAANLSVSCIDQDPFNPSIIYYGTGEPVGNSADVPGEGIFRSTDGGNTFAPLQATLNENFKYIWDLKCSLTEPGVLYAGTKNSLYRSGDSGKTFTKIFDPGRAINDIEVFPDSSVIVGVSYKGLYKSTNGKKPFTLLDNGLPVSNFRRVELAYCRDSFHVVYAQFTSSNGRSLRGIWRSDNGGASWTRAGNPDPNGLKFTLSWYALTLGVHPADPDQILSGSVNLGYSGDGGKNWSKVNNSHADYHTIVNYRTNYGNLLIGNDGGIYKYNWKSLLKSRSDRNQGYQVTQFYAGAFFPEGHQVIGGTQDNGTHAANSGANSFKKVHGADGAFAGVDQNTPQIVYISTQYGRIRRTDNFFDNSPSFQKIYNDMDANNDNNIDDDVWFINPFEVNRNDGRQVYFVTQKRIWRTTDYGDNWEPITNIISGIVNFNKRLIPYCIGMSYQYNPTLYIGGSNGLFYRINDGASAEPGDEVDLRESVPDEVDLHFISSIKVHPHNPSILYAGFSNYSSEPRIWKVTQATGNSPQWSPIDGNLPDELPVNWIEADPLNPDSIIIAATDFGLYITHNGGKTWNKAKDIPNVSIHQVRLRYSDRQLFLFTHGRGIWTGQLLPEGNYSVSNEEAPGTPDKNLKVFPNPASDHITVAWPGETISPGTISLLDLNGKVAGSWESSGPENRIDLQGIPTGCYLLVLKNKETTRSIKFLKQ